MLPATGLADALHALRTAARRDLMCKSEHMGYYLVLPDRLERLGKAAQNSGGGKDARVAMKSLRPCLPSPIQLCLPPPPPPLPHRHKPRQASQSLNRCSPRSHAREHGPSSGDTSGEGRYSERAGSNSFGGEEEEEEEEEEAGQVVAEVAERGSTMGAVRVVAGLCL
ncbi:hypothetical protein BJY52DRAFT_1187453 [Lactarius psammicola]|nr:hypothetical protein BJY52DRAFT_1187453 [Lactarius psammicola]